MQHVWGTGKLGTGYVWGNVRKEDNVKDPGVHDNIKINI